ncbi:MAG: hypothetical protein IKG04_08875 [Exiguobacterium sp.]|nr:hypothetical protein [Exiguobacterium sp.]
MAENNITREDALRLVATFSDDGMSNFLEHHGVKGMKWGVRSSETLRKYGFGGLKKGPASSKTKKVDKSVLKSRLSGAVMKKVEAAKAKYESEKIKRSELNSQRKELGMKRSEYNKLRDSTLKSHDPSVVAKGMHTLTDQELSDKIKRLQSEDKIAKMASSQAKARYEVKKTRNEALNNNPLVSIGRNVVEDTLKSSFKTLVLDTAVKGGAQPVLEKKVKKLAKKAEMKMDAKERAEEAKKQKRVQKKADQYKAQLAKKQKRSDAQMERNAKRYTQELANQRSNTRSYDSARLERSKKRTAEAKEFLRNM